MGLRRDEHGERGGPAGSDVGGDVKRAADECPAGSPDLHSVEPDDGGVVDAVEVEPDVLAFVRLWHVDLGAVPVRGVGEALGDVFRAVVFAVEGLGVDLVIDERGEHSAGNGGGVPAFGFVAGGGDGSAGIGDFGCVLELPAGVDGDRGSLGLEGGGGKR